MLDPAPGEINREISQPELTLHWPSVLQLVFSALGALLLLAAAAIFAIMSLGQVFAQSGTQVDLTTGLLWTAGLIFTGFFLVLSARVALLRLLGHSRKIEFAFAGPGWIVLSTVLLIGVLPVVLFLGHQVSTRTQLAWIFLPALHLVAVSIPVFWLLVYGLRGLPLGSAQRAWGLFGTGIALGPILILLVELVLLGIFSTLVFTILASQPGQAEEIMRLAQRLQISPPSSEVILRILQPYLLRPEVIGLGFIFIAVCVPLIEETLKPLGAWALVGRRLSPTEGFTAGLICGAGYALFENLFLGSTVQEWSMLVLARAGTGVIHMFTSALVGWGLASAWSAGRYGRLGLSFAGAVLIHGLWNGLTLLALITEVSDELMQLPPVIDQLGRIAPAGLGVLALVCFFSIWVLNRGLKRAIIHGLSS